MTRLRKLIRYAGSVGILCLSVQITLADTAPGGFIEPTGSAQARPLLSSSQINNLLPNRGRFVFPAPYNTEAFRLTNSSDCGGANCVHYVGYSYWRNTNNHVGQDRMLVLVGLKKGNGGAGPSIIAYNKQTDQVEPLGPIFNSSDSLSTSNAEGFYFSGTLPHALYVIKNSTLYRYDVMTRQYDEVFDANDHLGNGHVIWQAHSSDDDRVHSATLKSSGNYSDKGCVVYREDTNQLHYFPKIGAFDECQIDRSGKWLVIKENVDNRRGEDNRIINMETLHERVLLDEDGAGGHSDLGHGYMVAADNWANEANTQMLWDFEDNQLRGTRLYYNHDWGRQAPAHVSHTNSIAGVAPEHQYACGSSANSQTSVHANEIICFGLADDDETLVVAPVMTDINASGGGDFYGKSPKGNLDVTGQYFIWTSNMRGSRLDVFMVKVPQHLLTGGQPIAPPPPEPEPEPDPGELIFISDFES